MEDNSEITKTLTTKQQNAESTTEHEMHPKEESEIRVKTDLETNSGTGSDLNEDIDFIVFVITGVEFEIQSDADGELYIQLLQNVESTSESTSPKNESNKNNVLNEASNGEVETIDDTSKMEEESCESFDSDESEFIPEILRFEPEKNIGPVPQDSRKRTFDEALGRQNLLGSFEVVYIEENSNITRMYLDENDGQPLESSDNEEDSESDNAVIPLEQLVDLRFVRTYSEDLEKYSDFKQN